MTSDKDIEVLMSHKDQLEKEAFILQQGLQELKDEAMGEIVKQRLADIDAEFSPKTQEIQARIAAIDAQLKAATIDIGHTVKGESFMVVLSPAKEQIEVNTDKLLGLAVAIPKINECITRTMRPAVASIRKVAK